MSEAIISKDLRRVLKILPNEGGSMMPEILLQAELTVYNFHINHILGVIDQKIHDFKTLQRFHEQGWSYLHKPIWQALTRRPSAHRRENLLFATDIDPKVYDLLVHNFLEADMTQEELHILLVELPAYGQGAVIQAVRASKNAGVRNLHYLQGVLRREIQIQDSKQKRLINERYEAEPWMPDGGYRPLLLDQLDRMERRWRELGNDISTLRQLI